MKSESRTDYVEDEHENEDADVEDEDYPDDEDAEESGEDAEDEDDADEDEDCHDDDVNYAASPKAHAEDAGTRRFLLYAPHGCCWLKLFNFSFSSEIWTYTR